MNDAPAKISLEAWDERYALLYKNTRPEVPYIRPLGCHAAEGDSRLRTLQFDNAPAALRLWNFLLSEEDRLHDARKQGKRIVGTMKDLGTVPVMAYALPDVVAFYPDGAWWTPCIMECSAGLLSIADSMGITEAFCPVRAMIGAFVNEAHFPIPDLLTCSVGATCDDFSAIAQRVEALGHPILWWEIPKRRTPDSHEETIILPGGFRAAASQIAFVRTELERIREALEDLSGNRLDDAALSAGIAAANQVRVRLAELRRLVFSAPACPLPALEMLIAEMLAIHFCSDREETIAVLDDLLAEVQRRVQAGAGVLPADAVRVFWVNPVADLRAMNLLEQCGGRICGTEYLFTHALDTIPETLPPMEALARMAQADPMVGDAADRATRICADINAFGAEAMVLSRIPGASHCATESSIIAHAVQEEAGIPVVEIEVPPLSDTFAPALSTRLEALMEIARARRTG